MTSIAHSNSLLLQRRRRALTVTLTLACVIAIPAASLWYWAKTAASETYNLNIAIPDFLYQDANGQPFSKFDLEGHITLVAVLPAGTDGRRLLQELTTFVEQRLIFRNATESSPIRLVALTNDQQNLPQIWRQIIGPLEVGTLIPATASRQDAGLAIIDQGPNLRQWRLLLGAGQEFDKLKPMLSKLVIKHYMRDYLAKRTFFRRIPKTVDAEPMH